MNQNNKKYLVLALAALPLLNSCSDSSVSYTHLTLPTN